MKSRRTFLFAGAFAAALLVAAVSFASVPQTISYQGFLADSGGLPLNGTVQMQFKLYSSASGGTALWSETHSNVQVTQGSYSVVLGNGSPTPVPIDLPFDVQYYLGVTVGSDAEMTPRLPLTSTGYAFRAMKADSLSSTGTITATNAIVSTVPTGVAPLQVSSTTLVPNLNADMVDGKHANDFVAKTGDTMTGSLTLSSGNLNLPTTTASSGIIMQNGLKLMHTYGIDNFFAGTNAGNFTMTGSFNTANGANALSFNTTGYDNTASGYQALYSNTTGYGNTANGYYALAFNTTGDINTAIGYRALVANTIGSANSASGAYALAANTTGQQNTASGSYALADNQNGSGNNAVGVFSLTNNTSGDGNTSIGWSALRSNQTGSFNTGLGYYADVSSGELQNATAIGFFARVSASNSIRIGNTDITHIGGQVGFSNDSDMREKKDIHEIGYGLGFIKQLRPVQFRMITGNDRIDFGFIAQDIEALLGTDYNVLGIGGDADRTLSLRYTDFIAPMVKAMQEQQEIIDDLKARIEKLEALLAAKP